MYIVQGVVKKQPTTQHRKCDCAVTRQCFCTKSWYACLVEICPYFFFEVKTLRITKLAKYQTLSSSFATHRYCRVT